MRAEDVPPHLLAHSLVNRLSSAGMAGWRKREWRKKAASLESLPMHGAAAPLHADCPGQELL